MASTAKRAAALLLAWLGGGACAETFITLGDWGGKALGSYQAVTVGLVAKAMAKTAEQAKAQFIINVGDNFYYCGIQNSSDFQVAEDWLEPYNYPSLDIPWYSILGNHEYGYNVEAQLELTALHANWVMPSRYYTKRLALGNGAAHVSFIFIDTSPCFSAYRASDPAGWDPCSSQFPTCNPVNEGTCHFHANILGQDCGTQFAWFKKALAAVPADDWLIVVGHHLADQIDVEDFTTSMQTRGFDLYLNGHAHTLTQYAVDGDSAFVTSGAGAMINSADQDTEEMVTKLSGGNYQQPPITPRNASGAAEPPPPVGHTYQSLWNDKTPGYTLHTFSADYTSLRTDYINYNNDVIHTFTVQRGKKPGPGPSPPPRPPTPPPGPSRCCYYGDKWCAFGEVCCRENCDDPSTCGYSEHYCASKYGQKHHCKWTHGHCKVD